MIQENKLCIELTTLIHATSLIASSTTHSDDTKYIILKPIIKTNIQIDKEKT